MTFAYLKRYHQGTTKVSPYLMEDQMKVWNSVKAILLSVIMLSIPMGFCPKCGTKRMGYALRIPRYQACPKCGAGLEIIEDGKRIGSGFSPFTAEEYNTKPTDQTLKTKGKIEDKDVKE